MLYTADLMNGSAHFRNSMECASVVDVTAAILLQLTDDQGLCCVADATSNTCIFDVWNDHFGSSPLTWQYRSIRLHERACESYQREPCRT